MKLKKAFQFGVLMLLFAFASSMFTGPAEAITNGTPDAENHPYVCLIVADVEGEPAWRGTGVLISPTVVLTAGHVAEGADGARVWFNTDVTYNAIPYPLYPYGGPGSGAIEGTPIPHPDYTSPMAASGNGIPTFSYHDVGVVILDEPKILSEYGALPAVGLVDTLKVQTRLDLVGYGVQYKAQIPGNELPGPPPYYRWTGPRIRMYAPATLLSGTFTWSDEFIRCSANVGQGKGGTAFGDSGGPVFLAGTNTILAVNSYVPNINCAGVTYAQRVDISNIQTWITSLT